MRGDHTVCHPTGTHMQMKKSLLEITRPRREPNSVQHGQQFTHAEDDGRWEASLVYILENVDQTGLCVPSTGIKALEE